MQKISLAPEAEQKLETLYARGLKQGQLGDALQQLGQFFPAVQVEILERLEEVDWATIHNKGGFLKGIMERYRTRPPLHLTTDDIKSESTILCPPANALLEMEMCKGTLTRSALSDGILQVCEPASTSAHHGDEVAEIWVLLNPHSIRY